LPLITISIDRVEADDVIAYIARNKFLDKKIVIMSSDKDFMQLVDPRINIYFPTKKEVLDEKRLTEEFNIKPSNFIFYRIVDGDSSDNIPGVKNVGIKRLLKHLDLKNMDINNIDNFLDTVKTVNKPLNDNALSKIIEEEEQVRLNYKLMNLRNNDMMSAHASTQVDFILKDYEIPNLNKIEFLKMANDDNL